jgi:hypothetical protein
LAVAVVRLDLANSILDGDADILHSGDPLFQHLVGHGQQVELALQGLSLEATLKSTTLARLVVPFTHFLKKTVLLAPRLST